MLTHKAMEIIAQIRGAGPDPFARECREKAEALLKSGDVVQFDFGDMTPLPIEEWHDLQAYGRDLIAADLFALPFDKVAFSYRADNQDTLLTLWMEGEVTRWTGLTEVRLAQMNGRRLHQYYGGLVATNSAALEALRSAGLAPSNHDASRVAIVGGPLADDDLFFDRSLDYSIRSGISQDTIKTAVYAAIALNCLLQAKGVETAVEPAPVKLNKKRRALGKPPIVDTRRVVIRVGGKVHGMAGRAGYR